MAILKIILLTLISIQGLASSEFESVIKSKPFYKELCMDAFSSWGKPLLGNPLENVSVRCHARKSRFVL